MKFCGYFYRDYLGALRFSWEHSYFGGFNYKNLLGAFILSYLTLKERKNQINFLKNWKKNSRASPIIDVFQKFNISRKFIKLKKKIKLSFTHDNLPSN